MKMLLLLLMLSSMLGCKSLTDRVDTACSWVRPISTTAEDRRTLSRGTKEQIVALNDMWKSKCGETRQQ